MSCCNNNCSTCCGNHTAASYTNTCNSCGSNSVWTNGCYTTAGCRRRCCNPCSGCSTCNTCNNNCSTCNTCNNSTCNSCSSND